MLSYGLMTERHDETTTCRRRTNDVPTTSGHKKAGTHAEFPLRGTDQTHRHHMVIMKPTMIITNAMSRFHAPMPGIG
ncbi:hypothetical protein BHAP_0060 [Bifidobacterium hapali]|uniref:Uncharacterized protein n=1 Tax=Bifidobacterium hapali TaxID=1630172 RepID=A0A261G5E7_9BIFI|nr:hypothetical protein BHAP_0060 [Bifidobacterium hapali]